MEGVYAEGVPPYAAQGGGDCPGTDAGSGTESDDVLLRGAGGRKRKTDRRGGPGGFQCVLETVLLAAGTAGVRLVCGALGMGTDYRGGKEAGRAEHGAVL